MFCCIIGTPPCFISPWDLRKNKEWLDDIWRLPNRFGTSQQCMAITDVLPVWSHTSWKIPSENKLTFWIIGGRQKCYTVGIIWWKASKKWSLGSLGQIYCHDIHLSIRRDSLAGVLGPDPRSATSQTRYCNLESVRIPPSLFDISCALLVVFVHFSLLCFSFSLSFYWIVAKALDFSIGRDFATLTWKKLSDWSKTNRTLTQLGYPLISERLEL